MKVLTSQLQVINSERGIAYVKLLIFALMLVFIFWEIQQSFKQVAGLDDGDGTISSSQKSADQQQCIGSDPRDCYDLYEGTDLSAKNPN